MTNRCPSCGEASPPGVAVCPFCATPLSAGSTLVDRDKIKSAEIIAHLAQACGCSPTETAAVVDGLWEYLSDASHYTHGAGDQLVIPHFGIFLRRFQDRPIEFQSRKREELSAATLSSEWTNRSKGPLSVRRRIATAIAESKELELRAADVILNALFALLAQIFQRGRARIVWARRGVMSPTKTRYRLRLFPSFVNRFEWE